MKSFLHLKNLILFIAFSLMPAFAEEMINDAEIVLDELPTIQPELPEIPNVADSTGTQMTYGLWEQYGGYFIVAIIAIVLLILFLLLYFYIVKKSKVNFANSNFSKDISKQRIVNVGESLYSEDNLSNAIKSFLIKTNLLR